MLHRHHLLLLSLFLVIFTPLFFLSSAVSLPAVAQSVTEDIYGWAWSSEGGQGIGWISFNSKNCDTDGNDKLDPACGGDNTQPIISYGVKIKNNQIYGYAWSGNLGVTGTAVGGYLYFGPDRTAKTEAATGKDWAYLEGNTVKGFARFCTAYSDCVNGTLNTPAEKNGGWDGWLSLSGSTYGVKYNNSTDQINGKGCGSANYLVNSKSFYGCAWGGAVETDTNRNAQFPGWVDFNYSLTSTTPVPPGTGGGTCSNGVMDPGEAGVDCGGVCPGTCGYTTGGGTNKCPDGTDKSTTGVFRGDLEVCPLFINDCQLTQGTSIISPDSSISLGNYVWKVIASGGSKDATYNIVWKESLNGGSEQIVCGNSPTCSRSYNTAGQNVSMKVSVNTTDRTAIVRTNNCHSDYSVVSSLATDPGIIFYNVLNAPSLEAYAQFRTSASADVYDKNSVGNPLSIKIGYTNPVCSGSNITVSFVGIEKMVNGVSSVVPSSSYSVPSFGPAKSFGSTFVANGFKLLQKNSWPSSADYRVKLKATLSGGQPGCAGKNKEFSAVLKVRSSTGEYIEQ